MPQLTCGLAVMIGRCWPLLVALGGPREGPVASPRTLIAKRSGRASGRPRQIPTLTREVTTGRTRRLHHRLTCSGAIDVPSGPLASRRTYEAEDDRKRFLEAWTNA